MTDSVKNVVKADPYDDNEVLQYMQEEYVGAEDNDEARAEVVKRLSDEFDKPLASIRGKLGALGVYKPKIVVNKGNGVTKDKLAEKLADIAKENHGVIFSDGEIESMAKMNKTALNKIIKMIEPIDFETGIIGESEEEVITSGDAILKGWTKGCVPEVLDVGAARATAFNEKLIQDRIDELTEKLDNPQADGTSFA